MDFPVIVPLFRRKTLLQPLYDFLQRQLAFASSLKKPEEVAMTAESEDIAENGLDVLKLVGERG